MGSIGCHIYGTHDNCQSRGGNLRAAGTQLAGKYRTHRAAHLGCAVAWQRARGGACRWPVRVASNAQEHEDECRNILRMVSHYVRSAGPAQLQDDGTGTRVVVRGETTATNNETIVAAGILRNLTQLEVPRTGLERAGPIVARQAKNYDLANTWLHALPMQGLVAEGSFFVRAQLFRAELQEASWTCVNAAEVNFQQANVQGARMTGIVLDGADLQNATLNLELWTDLYWDKDKAPVWPAGEDPPEPAGTSSQFSSEECLQRHGPSLS